MVPVSSRQSSDHHSPTKIKPSIGFTPADAKSIPRSLTPLRPADNEAKPGQLTWYYPDYVRDEIPGRISESGLKEIVIEPRQQGARCNPIAIYGRGYVSGLRIRQFEFLNGGVIEENHEGRLKFTGPHATDGTPRLLPDGRTVEGYPGYYLTRFDNGLITKHSFGTDVVMQSRED